VKPGFQRVLTHWNQGFMAFGAAFGAARRGAARTGALKVPVW